MTTSKSPRRVLQVAYDAACQAVPAHRYKFSPKKFTQPQLLACLVLKEFVRLDYRGFAEHLMDHPDVAGQIGMKTVPHFTTFQKAARRLLLAAPARKLFDSVLERALRDGVRKRRVPLAAVDGTGWESRHTSRSYVKRRSRSGDRDQITTYAKFPKVVFVVDCTSHMILAAVPGRGPGSDLVPFDVALEQAVRRARIETLLADADFDAEWVHRGVRSHGIRSLIPPTRGRPTHKPPMGYWRRRMKQRFGRYKPKYGQRWQVETVNSMVKRRLGSALRARKYQSQCRETMLRAITHNVMIVRLRVFYRATRDWISLRRSHSSLRRGTLLDLDAGPDHYLFARRDATETVVIAFNRSDKPVSASFTSSALEARAGVALVHLLGVGEATHVQGEQVALMLPPCSVAAYQVR